MRQNLFEINRAQRWTIITLFWLFIAFSAYLQDITSTSVEGYKNNYPFTGVLSIGWLLWIMVYAKIQLKNKGHLINESLTKLEKHLDPQQFIRVHRSIIVNIDFIKEFIPHLNSEYIIVLENDAKVKLSRSYKNLFKEIIGSQLLSQISGFKSDLINMYHFLRSCFQLPLFFFLSLYSNAQTVPMPENVRAVYENEKAFSAYCAQNGIQKSFLKYFDEKGISFSPHPVNARAYYTLEPADSGYLTWEPKIIEVSKDGTLGFSTGTVKYKARYNADTVYHSHYFSIWQKKGERWKVMLDKGVRYKDQYPETEFIFYDNRGGSNSNISFERLVLIDKQSSGNPRIYIDQKTIFGRNGNWPFVGKDRLPDDLTQIKNWQVLDGQIARSGDFAYMYGYYELNTAFNECGYFIRVWVYELNQWRLRVDLHNALRK